MTSSLNQTIFTLANASQLITEAALRLQSQAVNQAMSNSRFSRDSLSLMAIQGVREKVASS